MALIIPACGSQDNSDGGNNPAQQASTEQAFKTFNTALDNLIDYEGNLTIKREGVAFSGENKDQMNTPGHWVSTDSTIKSYDSNTGHLFTTDPYWNGVYTSSVSKSFDGEIGYFDLQDDGFAYDYYLVDKTYGSYKIKEGIVSSDKYEYSIFNDGVGTFLTYDICIYNFEQIKANELLSLETISADYAVSSKTQNGFNVIEATYCAKSENEYSQRQFTYTYTITFTNDFVVSFQKASEEINSSKEDDSTYYNYFAQNYSFSKEFLQAEYDAIDSSALSKPIQRITQEIHLFVDDKAVGVYTEPFGTSLEDYINNKTPKDNSTGYKVYLDENHTIPYTGQTSFSYKTTSLYLISQPVADHATIITRFIYEKKSGERKIDNTSSAIVEAVDYTFPDDPWDGTFQTIATTFSGARFAYDELYINGEKQADSYLYSFIAMPGEIYYNDRIHKQKDLVSINLYDSLTGQLWTTVNAFEEGTYWEYVQYQLKSGLGLRYHGLELGGLRLTGVKDTPTGTALDKSYTINDGDNIYVTVRPETTGTNMVVSLDLETNSIQAATYPYNASNTITFYLRDYETLIINNCEIKTDGKVADMVNSDGKFTYDIKNQKVLINLRGGVVVIKYKTAQNY